MLGGLRPRPRSWLAVTVGIAAAWLGLTAVVLAKKPAVSCGTRIPGLVPPAWPGAHRELVPPGAVAGQVCLAGARGRFVRASGLTQQWARDLAAGLDAIPAANPAAPAGCASASPSEVLVTFGYRTGRVLRVEAELGGCSVVTNGAVFRNATGRFDHLIGDLASLSGGSPPPIPALVETRGSPGCSTVTAPQVPLSGIQITTVPVPLAPFGIASTPDAKWSFVAFAANQVEVLSDATGTPAPARVVDVAPRLFAGASMTPDGRYLLVAGRPGAYVLSAKRLEQGLPRPVVGVLAVPNAVVAGEPIEVITSPDGRYAFVSVEDSDEIAVFDLHAAIAHGFDQSAFVGAILLGRAVVGMAVSPNGKLLYATSERAADGNQGSLSVINLRDAETRPDEAIQTNVSAGCGPVRVAVSPDGSTVWVTARGSDALLGFSAAALLRHPSRALRADVPVGEAPVGLAVVNKGRQVVVADSDRFNTPHATPALTLVDVAAALGHRPAVVGSLPTGLFPREISLESNGTLLVGDFLSRQIQAINTTELP